MFVDSSIVHSCPNVHTLTVLTAAAAQVPGPAQVQRAQSPARRREEPAQAQVRVRPQFTFIKLLKLSATVACLNQVIFYRLQVWRRPEVPVSEAPEPAQEEVTIAGEEEQEQVRQEVSGAFLVIAQYSRKFTI